MTKVGEGNQPSQPKSKKNYQQELQQSCFRFRKVLHQYKDAASEERKRIAVTMREVVSLMVASLNELERQGVHKHNVRLEHDVNAYLQKATSENYAALEQDITTLLERCQAA